MYMMARTVASNMRLEGGPEGQVHSCGMLVFLHSPSTHGLFHQLPNNSFSFVLILAFFISHTLSFFRQTDHCIHALTFKLRYFACPQELQDILRVETNREMFCVSRGIARCSACLQELRDILCGDRNRAIICVSIEVVRCFSCRLKL